LKKEVERREIDEKKKRFKVLFGLKEREEKYKKEKCV